LTGPQARTKKGPVKKILALGGGGLIGSYVVRELLRNDFDSLAFVREKTM
jgi:uncharacterized protein YbjT (DUF2867 family)